MKPSHLLANQPTSRANFFALRWMLWSLALAGNVAPLSAAPKITGFSPRTGAPGTTVTLTGSGLGTVNVVQFNSADAKI